MEKSLPNLKILLRAFFWTSQSLIYFSKETRSSFQGQNKRNRKSEQLLAVPLITLITCLALCGQNFLVSSLVVLTPLSSTQPFSPVFPWVSRIKKKPGLSSFEHGPFLFFSSLDLLFACLSLSLAYLAVPFTFLVRRH